MADERDSMSGVMPAPHGNGCSEKVTKQHSRIRKFAVPDLTPVLAL